MPAHRGRHCVARSTAGFALPVGGKLMSDKPIPDTFGPAESGAPHPRSRQSAQRHRLRAALIAIAAGAITVSAVVDGYAQRVMTMGRVNIPTPGVRAPVVDVPRAPVVKSSAVGAPIFSPGCQGAVIMFVNHLREVAAAIAGGSGKPCDLFSECGGPVGSALSSSACLVTQCPQGTCASFA